ncbi:MAG: ArsR/SmtB family transcription factor [Candidatus Syntropharchaeales archaeon]
MKKEVDSILSNPNRRIILSILLKSGDKGQTAYSLEKCDALAISISAISQHLKKMEEFGLICGEVSRDNGVEGRYKKIYTISDECKKALIERVKDDVGMFISKMPLTDRIYFFKHVESILDIPKSQLSLHALNGMMLNVDGGDVND